MTVLQVKAKDLQKDDEFVMMFSTYGKVKIQVVKTKPYPIMERCWIEGLVDGLKSFAIYPNDHILTIWRP